MFGKDEWFKVSGKRLLWPASKQGAGYYLTWFSVVLLPGWLLWTVTNWPQALIWLFASGTVFALDYRSICRRKTETEAFQNLFRIDDDSTEEASRSDRAETANYEIEISS